jgi:hypothetical protein
MRAVPRLCEFYPGICITTEGKARKTLSQGKKNLKVHYTYYQKHPDITKPSQTHTLQNPLIHTHALHVFLILAVGGGERSSARVRRFKPGTY